MQHTADLSGWIHIMVCFAGKTNAILRVIAEASIPVRDNYREKSFQVACWMYDSGIGKATFNRMKLTDIGHL